MPVEKITRRTFLIASVATAGVLATACLRPWERLTTAPEQEEQETLESLVAKAKKMEDEFTGTDLSGKEARAKHTNLLADIFARYYPVGISREQLLSSVFFTDSKEAFEEIYVNLNQAPNLSTQYLKKEADGTPAFTADGKAYINTTNEIFQKHKTASNPNFPKDWHPLKSLRLALFHEFSHVISQPAVDSAIFSVVDPRNDITDKQFAGFQIKGLTNKRESVGLYSSIDVATAELLSKYINTDLFNLFLSDFSDIQGNNVTAIMIRLEKLVDSAKIDKMELAYLHKTSNLRGFLLLLAERYGISPQKIPERGRIIFGFTLFEALVQNNQAILQDYMNTARRFNK